MFDNSVMMMPSVDLTSEEYLAMLTDMEINQLEQKLMAELNRVRGFEAVCETRQEMDDILFAEWAKVLDDIDIGNMLYQYWEDINSPFINCNFSESPYAAVSKTAQRIIHGDVNDDAWDDSGPLSQSNERSRSLRDGPIVCVLTR